jgi:general secretion pathway protein K
MSYARDFPACRPYSNARADRKHERGWALISALWAITMLALMAAATEALTATSYRAEAHAITTAKADAALDAGVVRAVLGISDTRPQMRWRTDGTHRRFWLEGIQVDVSVQGELGRVDLNTSGNALIRQLLIGNGVPQEKAGLLTDRITAWRSATGLETLMGGGDEGYAAADLPYRPRHGPFQTVDELKLVLGMTPEIFAAIAPALTVYSKRAMFDASIAPREALRALYPDDDAKIDEILQQREGLRDAVPGLGTTPGQSTALSLPTGQAFSIAAATTIGNRTFRRSAVVQMTGSTDKPYYVLNWR